VFWEPAAPLYERGRAGQRKEELARNSLGVFAAGADAAAAAFAAVVWFPTIVIDDHLLYNKNTYFQRAKSPSTFADGGRSLMGDCPPPSRRMRPAPV
jgi:hypothetical protein